MRGLLVECLAHRTDTRTLSEAERSQVLDVFLTASNDPNETPRVSAIYALLRFCERHGFRPEMKPAIPAMIDEIIDLKRAHLSSSGVEPVGARADAVVRFASAYGKEASAAIPRLLNCLGDSDPEIVTTASTALSMIDATDQRVVSRIRELLSSPNPETQKIAQAYLQRLGEPPNSSATQP
jgi:hypothetical protein